MIKIKYQPQPNNIQITLPPSKSIAARALIANSLSNNPAVIHNLPDCDDTIAILHAISDLKQHHRQTDVNAAGTALRFITALAAATPQSDITLHGTPRLAQRPIQPLADALHSQGAEIIPQNPPLSLPLRIKGTQLKGREITIPTDLSSQYISALMLVAPTALRPVTIPLPEHTVSLPYIHMTAKIMTQFGAEIKIHHNRIEIHPSHYTPPADFTIEPDWSAVSYIYQAAAAMPEGTQIHIQRLTPPAQSAQGDSRCAQIFTQLGVHTNFHPDGSATLTSIPHPILPDLSIDLQSQPDLAPAIAAAAAMRRQPLTLTGLQHLHIKECDRIATLTKLLNQIGAHTTSTQSTITIHPAELIPNPTIPIDPDNDHRMAMALAITAIKTKSITILHPETVNKSWPRFWQQIRKLGLQTHK